MRPRPMVSGSTLETLIGIMFKGGLLLALRVFGVALSLAATVILTRTLEPAAFGVLALAMACTMLFSLVLTLNIEAGSPIFITRMIAQGHHATSRAFMRFSFAMTSALSVVFLIGMTCWLLIFDTSQSWQGENISMGPVFWICAIVSTVAPAFSRLYARFGSAEFQQAKAQGPRTFVQPASFAFLIVVLWLTPNSELTVTSGMIALTVSNLVTLATQITLVRISVFNPTHVDGARDNSALVESAKAQAENQAGDETNPQRKIDPDGKRQWISTAARLSPSVIIYEDFVHFTVFAASFALQSADIAILAVCLRIAALLRFALTAIETATMPRLARDASLNNKSAVNRVMDIATLLRLTAVIPTALICAFFADDILRLFRPEYETGAASLAVITLLTIAHAGVGPGLSMLVAAGKDRAGTIPLFVGLFAVGGGFYLGGLVGGLLGSTIGGLIGWVSLDLWLYLILRQSTSFDPSVFGLFVRSFRNAKTGTAPTLTVIAAITFAVGMAALEGEAQAKPPPGSDYELILKDDFNDLRFSRAGTPLGGLWSPIWKFGPYLSYVHPSSKDALFAYPGIKDQSGSPLPFNPFEIDNGILKIKAGVIPSHLRKTALELVATGDPSVQPTSDELEFFTGGIGLYDAWSSRGGYFEMRARLPKGQGFWPAFWLTTTKGWPPEIDILEAVYDEKKRRNANTVHTSIHYKPNVDGPNARITEKTNVKRTLGADIYDDFHTYAAAWTEDSVTFFFDGAEIFQAPAPPSIDEPMYAIIDLHIGALNPDPYWTLDVEDPSIFTEAMEIDYVAIYAPVSEGPLSKQENNLYTDTLGNDMIMVDNNGGEIHLSGGIDRLTLGPGLDLINIKTSDDSHVIISSFDEAHGDQLILPDGFIGGEGAPAEQILRVGDDTWVIRGARDSQAPQTIIFRNASPDEISKGIRQYPAGSPAGPRQ